MYSNSLVLGHQHPPPTQHSHSQVYPALHHPTRLTLPQTPTDHYVTPLLRLRPLQPPHDNDTPHQPLHQHPPTPSYTAYQTSCHHATNSAIPHNPEDRPPTTHSTVPRSDRSPHSLPHHQVLTLHPYGSRCSHSDHSRYPHHHTHSPGSNTSSAKTTLHPHTTSHSHHSPTHTNSDCPPIDTHDNQPTPSTLHHPYPSKVHSNSSAHHHSHPPPAPHLHSQVYQELHRPTAPPPRRIPTYRLTHLQTPRRSHDSSISPHPAPPPSCPHTPSGPSCTRYPHPPVTAAAHIPRPTARSGTPGIR